MLNILRVATVGVVFVSAASAQEATISSQDLSSATACQSARGLESGEGVLCSCAPDAMSGSVWGTDAYTSDSSVCAAALHAGAVPPSGGVVVMTGAAGLESYQGSERNGITTRDWGSYGSSFFVEAAVIGAGLEQCGVLPSDVDAWTCACPEGSGSSGSVWGYGPYTSDSDICTAARHTGLIDGKGGTVTVLRVQGLERYVGGMSNGIETRDWNSYGSSIVFDWNAP